MRLTSDQDVAEDLAQDTLVLVINKLRHREVRQPERLTSFLYSTAKYMYFGWLRKRDNQVELRESMDTFESITTTGSDEFEMQVVAQRLIDNLSTEEDREVLTRYYSNEQSKRNCCGRRYP